ncbi:MAG: aminotransferase class III-fold pyridoxal phosphate-dependent enzyme ['Candidatus Kapabacteria' thiocyanatum]|uniref:Aspartate aminotransferase family protein n=1 Tax=Candidatus Kapaibacterium thiocyanatum TaxID=1895771 RepID=A0A1M3KWG1_9BACT|nr:aminotransferase class III-fold pyridoxal phosphate-dependent enzyme ['Candidatus Kapabacteria' thiocyanatum]OJX56715.1 MAG: aspartate aminotransferase family protein ['Candidatus Kapabacteria' thiocyanatum]
MNPLPVYSLMPIELVRGSMSTVWDADGNSYLDLYGGHAVISIGHAHPAYVQAIAAQAERLGFYSNSVRIRIQEEFAERLGIVSGYDTYRLFLCNSGAEANENALKLASFVTGRSRIVAFDKAFHGRTSLAVATTDNPKIVAPVNRTDNVTFVPLNDIEAVRAELDRGDVAAVIVEGIQGVGGIRMADDDFLVALDTECRKHGAMLILDEIQSGCGRTGRYFAHQHAGIRPPLVTVAKGIGNGFPIGGVLVSPDIDVWDGMLGTTFGGNHLACAAAMSVIDVMESDDLMQRAAENGAVLANMLRDVPGVTDVRGRGLMIGMDIDHGAAAVRTSLVQDHRILTGNASNPKTIRLLPALNVSREELDRFVQALSSTLTLETT